MDVPGEIGLILVFIFYASFSASDELQGAARLTKDDIEKVFSLYDRVSEYGYKLQQH